MTATFSSMGTLDGWILTWAGTLERLALRSGILLPLAVPCLALVRERMHASMTDSFPRSTVEA